MKLTYKPSTEFGKYLRLVQCDHWEDLAEMRGGDKAVIRCKLNGATVAYNLHDGGNDWNGPRNLAAEMQRACGCVLIQPRGRKRSRKAFKPSGFSISGTRNDGAMTETIADLNAKHAQQRDEWLVLTANPSRGGVVRARELIAEIAEVEMKLDRFHQPVERIVR